MGLLPFQSSLHSNKISLSLSNSLYLHVEKYVSLAVCLTSMRITALLRIAAFM